jgi:hypothetical protein
LWFASLQPQDIGIVNIYGASIKKNTKNNHLMTLFDLRVKQQDEVKNTLQQIKFKLVLF